MGRPELAADDRFATHGDRGEREKELDELGAAWTRTRPIDETLASMVEHSVPAGRVYTAADMVTDPHYLAREMIQTITSRSGIELPTLGVVPNFSRTPGSISSPGPALGEHTP